MLNDQTSSMYDFVRKVEIPKVQKKTVAEALMNQSLFAGVGNGGYMRSKKIPIKNRQRFFYFLYTVLQAVASTNVATKNKKKENKNFREGCVGFFLI